MKYYMKSLLLLTLFLSFFGCDNSPAKENTKEVTWNVADVAPGNAAVTDVTLKTQLEDLLKEDAKTATVSMIKNGATEIPLGTLKTELAKLDITPKVYTLTVTYTIAGDTASKTATAKLTITKKA